MGKTPGSKQLFATQKPGKNLILLPKIKKLVKFPAGPFFKMNPLNRFRLRILSRLYLWSFFFVVIIPFLLSLWLFAYPIPFDFDRINQTRSIGNTTQPIQILKYPESHSPTEIVKHFTSNFLSNILHIPLELNSVYYCFRDKGSFMEYSTVKGSENDYINFNWTLNFNNEKNFTISRNGIKCELVKKDKEFTYNWEFNGVVTLRGGYTTGITFHRDTISFAKKNFIEVAAKSITLIIAWMSVCWMLNGVWKIIKK